VPGVGLPGATGATGATGAAGPAGAANVIAGWINTDGSTKTVAAGTFTSSRIGTQVGLYKILLPSVAPGAAFVPVVTTSAADVVARVTTVKTDTATGFTEVDVTVNLFTSSTTRRDAEFTFIIVPVQ